MFEIVRVNERLYFEIGTSHIASSEDNDLDREAAGDSGFSDGM